KKGDNHYFVDFGKAVIGGLQLTVEGVAGQNVEIRLGEELTAPHTVMYQLRTGNMYQETWTLKDGPQTIEHWGMRVFRYAEVVNAAVETGSIKALVLSYPFDEEAAEFECSNSVLNDVWDLCKYSIKATSLDLYVDTFTRERLPYEGDAYINQLSHYCVDREFALPRYSIEYLYYRPTWPTEYKQLSVLMAWEDYMYTGNKESLEQNYAVLTTKPLDQCINADGLVEKPIKDDLIDWPNSQRDGYVFTDVNTVINSINYKALRDMASIASVLQQQDDYAYYTSLADTLQDAMNEHLYDPVVGAYRDGRGVDHWATHASAFPLAFGVPTSQQAPRVAQYLAQRGMRVGVYGSQFLLQALYNGGEDQAALDLMSARTGNSWGHMIYDLGATIVTEAWDPAQKPNMSFSHAWASAPANTIVRGMFGILPLEPGFSVFQIKPQLGDLEWAKLQVPTIKGTIKVEVESTNKLFEMKVTIPTNTVATVFVPMQKGSILEYDQMVLAAEIAGGYAIIERVGSGIHTFTVRK
ncbi:MAG: family 78 glycoside hydrolase catalytic domain, partial [Limnochordia bacterium]|nr:family 78 glycoside hydrolase catalytic domain [Limnochordia bacterium]